MTQLIFLDYTLLQHSFDYQGRDPDKKIIVFVLLYITIDNASLSQVLLERFETFKCKIDWSWVVSACGIQNVSLDLTI